MIKHYLNFISTNRGLVEIDEPTGFDQAVFEIMQEEGRHGRDIFSVTNDKGKLKLDSMPNHCFDYIMEAMEQDGFEAEVKYLVEFDGVQNIVGDISFQSIVTDQQTFVELAIMEETFKTLLKKRFDVKTDLFSKLTLDKEEIDPLVPVKVLLKAKPIIQVSEWSNPTIGRQISSDSETADYFNPVKSQVQYEIQDSLSWLFDFDTESSNNFKHIHAATNLKNVNIDLALNVDWYYDVVNAGVGGLSDFYGYMNVRVLWGQSIEQAVENGTNHYLWEHYFYGEDNQEITLPTDLSYTIPFVGSTDFIWLSFSFASSNGSVNTATFKDCRTKITATSVAYNTVVPMVRLFDAMTYNVRSSADLPISAPRWAFGGEYYDQFITTQPLMRNLIKPFLISTKEIVEDYLPEVNGDYQIQKDGTVFFGKEEDFYKDYELASFKQRELSDEWGQPFGQIEGFEKSFNPEFTVNEFKYSNKYYASEKENETANTYDLVHGDIETLLPNKRVENKKVVEFGWVRDAFMAEKARRNAYDLSDNTATQDDDKIYIVDIVPLSLNTNFTETSFLQHKYNTETGFLELTNDNTFSWELLGIVPGVLFQILSGENEAVYLVMEVSPTVLILFNDTTLQVDATVNTTFKYFIDPNVVLTNRTNEGFSNIENIEDGENYANLRFSVKRNIQNYNSYLATCCMYNQDEEIQVTLYKNNPEAITQLTTEAVEVEEGAEFIPTNPILTPYLLNVKLVMTLQKFFDLEDSLRINNGYITTYDATGLPIKGYIQQAKWIVQNRGGEDAEALVGVCDTLLKEKYQQFYLEILSVDTGGIWLSNGDSANTFTYEITDNKLTIYDETGLQLFVPVPYNRVKVNNSGQASSVAELAQWLNLIQ